MHKCNLCGKSELLPLIDFGNHPVAKHYLENPSEAQPTWPVRLYFCEHCGLTQLIDSCPPDVLYENYVTVSSWKFQPHVQHEIDAIKSLPNITADSKIIEIGSNDGMFLHQMSQSGFKNTLGVEPAKDAYDLSVAKGINTLHAFLSPEVTSDIRAQYGEFDLFVSRQNLEHMRDLQEVARSIRTLVRPNAYVLIEVPDFACFFRWHDYSVWEEHVNYFTIDTLRRFLEMCGVELIHQETILFSSESIFVLGRKVDNVSCPLDYVPALRDQNLKYAAQWPIFRSAIREYCASQKEANKRIAVYGAGARIIGLINFTDIASSIDLIVDDQAEKQGKFTPGGKIPIVSSDALYSQSIDICFLAVNTENEEKVISKHEKWVRSNGAFWSVLPPSGRLIPVWQQSVEGCAFD